MANGCAFYFAICRLTLLLGLLLSYTERVYIILHCANYGSLRHTATRAGNAWRLRELKLSKFSASRASSQYRNITTITMGNTTAVVHHSHTMRAHKQSNENAGATDCTCQIRNRHLPTYCGLCSLWLQSYIRRR